MDAGFNSGAIAQQDDGLGRQIVTLRRERAEHFTGDRIGGSPAAIDVNLPVGLGRGNEGYRTG